MTFFFCIEPADDESENALVGLLRGDRGPVSVQTACFDRDTRICGLWLSEISRSTLSELRARMTLQRGL